MCVAACGTKSSISPFPPPLSRPGGIRTNFTQHLFRVRHQTLLTSGTAWCEKERGESADPSPPPAGVRGEACHAILHFFIYLFMSHWKGRCCQCTVPPLVLVVSLPARGVQTQACMCLCVCVYSITLHTCHIWWSPAQTILTSGFSNLSRIIHVTVLLFSHIHLKVICSSNCLAFHTRHRIFHKVSKKEEEIFWDSFSDSQSWVAPRLLVIYR